MGIRYYAYAVDAEHTALAAEEPHRFLSSDPLADAWGFPPGATSFVTNFEQAVPERDMLYLDKAWRFLQAITGPDGVSAARPSFRMFEGAVRHHAEGWDGFVRALTPGEAASISADLDALSDSAAADRLRGLLRPDADIAEETGYLLEFLGRARRFARDLALDGRGMVYTIR